MQHFVHPTLPLLPWLLDDWFNSWLSWPASSTNVSFVIEAHLVSLLVIIVRVPVPCTRQSPLMRGRFLRPTVVEVRYTRQSPSARGGHLRPAVVKHHSMRQVLRQGADHWGPLWLKSVVQDKVLQRGADHVGRLRSKSIVQDKVLRQGAVTSHINNAATALMLSLH